MSLLMAAKLTHGVRPALLARTSTSALTARRLASASASAHPHMHDNPIGNIRIALERYGGEILPLRAVAAVEELQSSKWKLNLFDNSISHDVRDQINTICSGLKAYFDSSLQALVVTTRRPQLASTHIKRKKVAIADPDLEDLEIITYEAPKRAHVKAKPNLRVHEMRSVMASTSTSPKSAARLEKRMMSSRRSRRQAIQRATEEEIENAILGVRF